MGWASGHASRGALFIVANLITLIVFFFAQGSAEGSLLFRSLITMVAEVLLLLGLIGLYTNQLEATGILGLLGFLIAFIGLALGPHSFIWAGLLADLGWALFGVSSLEARRYSAVASILIIIGAVIHAAATVLLSIGPSSSVFSILVVVGAIASITLNISIAWLGESLFSERSEAYRTTEVS